MEIQENINKSINKITNIEGKLYDINQAYHRQKLSESFINVLDWSSTVGKKSKSIITFGVLGTFDKDNLPISVDSSLENQGIHVSEITDNSVDLESNRIYVSLDELSDEEVATIIGIMSRHVTKEKVFAEKETTSVIDSLNNK